MKSRGGAASKARILVVEDDEFNAKLLENLLQLEGYATLLASDGCAAIQMAKTLQPDLILLDIMMPEMDGFEAVALLKKDPVTMQIPVIMVTALEDRESKIRALEAGAEELLNKPIDRPDLRVRVRNLLRLKEYSNFLANHNQILNEKVRERTAQLSDAYHETVLSLVRAAEHKDEETGLHVRRISYYCRALGEAMHLPTSFVETIFHASAMHDIGKIGIPDRILLKPGGFTPDEWEIMQTHCVLGEQILHDAVSPYVKMGAEIALSHHERWDGSGYPQGLIGDTIPLAARIMQICDVYDALRSRRPYKQPINHGRTMEIITKGDGRTDPTHFDPHVLSCFAENAEAFAAIYAQHGETEAEIAVPKFLLQPE